MNILAELRARFADALSTLTGDPGPFAAMVRPAQDPKFGDFQANCAMPLAKQLGQPPRDIAQKIVDALNVADLCNDPEVAGPGFINLRLRDDWLETTVNRTVGDENLGVEPLANPRRYVVDFSSPNVAKPMHVGHLRSTVIGDSLCRILRALGHSVVSDNHIGDWGTQFGMIIYGYKHFLDRAAYSAGAGRGTGAAVPAGEYAQRIPRSENRSAAVRIQLCCRTDNRHWPIGEAQTGLNAKQKKKQFKKLRSDLTAAEQ